MLKKQDYQLLFDLYTKYYKKQSKKSPVDLITDFGKFERLRKAKGTHFAWQKLMGMRLVDAIESAAVSKRKIVATEILRYAASNTDISTYFIKIE